MSATGRDGAHDEFEALAVGWALHSLEPEDAAAFAAHRATCPDCTRIVAETREVMAGMAGAVPGAEPSADLRSRLRAAVEQTEQVAAPGPPAPGPPAQDDAHVVELGSRRGRDRVGGVRRGLVTALVAAAAAVLGLGVGIVLGQDPRDEARVQDEIVAAVLSPGTATITAVEDDDGRRVATVLTRDEEVQLVTQGMTANDASDTTYVLWGIAAGAPEALGVFDVGSAGPELSTFSDVDAGYSGYGISLEDGRSAPEAPSEVLASGEVPA
jgi:anti-sigma-K factor RskA